MLRRFFRKTRPAELTAEERQELASRRQADGSARASGSRSQQTPTNPYNGGMNF